MIGKGNVEQVGGEFAGPTLDDADVLFHWWRQFFVESLRQAQHGKGDGPKRKRQVEHRMDDEFERIGRSGQIGEKSHGRRTKAGCQRHTDKLKRRKGHCTIGHLGGRISRSL